LKERSRWMTLATCRTHRERTRHARAPRSPLKPAAARCLAAPCSAACSADGPTSRQQPPPLPYKVDTSRPSRRTKWTRLVPTPSSDADWCRAAQGQGFPHVNVRAQGIASHKQAAAAGGSAAHHAGPTTAARILGCAPPHPPLPYLSPYRSPYCMPVAPPSPTFPPTAPGRGSTCVGSEASHEEHPLPPCGTPAHFGRRSRTGCGTRLI